MNSDRSQSSQDLLGTLARLYWMLFGLDFSTVICRTGGSDGLKKIHLLKFLDFRMIFITVKLCING